MVALHECNDVVMMKVSYFCTKILSLHFSVNQGVHSGSWCSLSFSEAQKGLLTHLKVPSFLVLVFSLLKQNTNAHINIRETTCKP